VVLSNPEPPELQAAEAPDAVGTPKGMPAGKVAQVRIISVEVEEGGRLYVSAQAPPGATVRLYLNDTFIAPGSVGSDSKVAFAIDRGVRPGDYRVRLDEVDPVSGEVKGRAEVPFALPVTVAVPLPPPAPPVVTEPEGSVTASVSGPLRPDGTRVASTEPTGDGANTVVIPSVDTVVVSRGESLWRISQRIYGSGYRYTTIFGANQKQIKDPNRIFPGQTFVLPPEQGRAGAR
jgi:nucleoid-associated protein YgaU